MKGSERVEISAAVPNSTTHNASYLEQRNATLGRGSL